MWLSAVGVSMNRIKCAIFLCLLTVVSAAWADDAPATADTFRVADIRIEGLQRVSPGSVFAGLPVNVGDSLEVSQLPELTRALFRSGYFDDIKISRDGNVLVVTVVERPTIAEITINGNKAIKTDDLNAALKKAGLAEGQIYKPSTLEGLSGELERQYVAQGRYGAKVKTELRTLPRNRVGLVINVDEGKIAAIKDINIIGNHAFKTQELLDQFQLSTTDWLSWMNSRDKYSREKLTGDIEKLKSFYLDRGYLRFAIESTQVALSPDKKSVFVTINIDEGPVYTVSGTDMAGSLIVPEDELRRLITLKTGAPFSQLQMTTSAESMTKRLGNEGYTFAEVHGMPERDDKNHTVKVTFFVEPSHRAYVNRINFRGNTKTADEVLRREMRQMESASANSAKIEQSKTRLERLGYFKTVDVATTDVPGTSDQLDVEYTVEEQASGSIGASVGFAQGSGVILGANIQQDNFLGTGKQVGFNVSTSSYSNLASFNYVDPYYTIDGVSRGFSLYYSTRDLGSVNVADYSVDTYGLDMNFGYPLSEIARLGFGVGYAHTQLKIGNAPAQEISGTPLFNSGIQSITQTDINRGCIDKNNCTKLASNPDPRYNPVYQGFVDKNGDTFNDVKLTGNWSESTLNKGRLATRGYSHGLALESTTPAASDLEYWKAVYRAQFFQPLTENLTLRLRGRAGYGAAYGSTNDLPFFENFYGGGFGSVRGYKRNTLGPRGSQALQYRAVQLKDGSVVYARNAKGSIADPIGNGDDPIGGDTIIDGSMELIFPMPFVKDQNAIQPSFFVDGGNVFDSKCSVVYGKTQENCSNIDFGDMRYSAGVGLTWVTGFGPLTFSIAKALNPDSLDKEEFFQFSLGQSF